MPKSSPRGKSVFELCQIQRTLRLCHDSKNHEQLCLFPQFSLSQDLRLRISSWLGEVKKQSRENGDVHALLLCTVGFQDWREKPEREALHRLGCWLLRWTGLLKAKTRDFFALCLRVARKYMVLFSFYPNGRENTNPDSGAERTEEKGKEEIQAFYLHSVACSSFNKHISNA